MFGLKGSGSGRQNLISNICNQTRVSGNILFNRKLQICGYVEGNIISKSDNSELQVLKSGRIVGDIRATSVYIDGTVKGNIFCRSIDIRHNAKISGNIFYEVIQIQSNSTINGELMLSDEYAKQRESSTSKTPDKGKVQEK